MKLWPADLPQRSTTNFSRGFGDSRLRTDTDAGGGKMRRRLSFIPQPVTCEFEMRQAQRELFERFVDLELSGGTLPFQIPSQDGAGLWIVQIGSRMPQWTPLGMMWLVRLDLVRLPQ